MDWSIREPCGSCPYRTDVAPGTWAPEEFGNLLREDQKVLHGTKLSMGHIFACHGSKNVDRDKLKPCAGWLLDQRRRGVPCINLTMLTNINVEAGYCLDEVSSPVPIYPSLAAMVQANVNVYQVQGKLTEKQETALLCLPASDAENGMTAGAIAALVWPLGTDPASRPGKWAATPAQRAGGLLSSLKALGLAATTLAGGRKRWRKTLLGHHVSLVLRRSRNGAALSPPEPR